MKQDFVKLAYFVDERKVALFQARLDEAGIPSFLSNSNANTLIPHLGGGIGVHIHKENLDLGQEILTKFKSMEEEDQSVFTHHEATHEDIEYEKQRNDPNTISVWSKLAFVLLALFIFRHLAKSLGILPQIFEPF